VGPFYAHGVAILEQVIEAGRHYADICDDWEPTLEMLDLSERASARNVTAVIGLGASPGITNMIAVKAARALDDVRELITCWSIEGDPGDLEVMRKERAEGKRAGAAVVHWVQQLTGTIRVLSDGQFRHVPPLQRRNLPFPGIGPVSTWTVGHPEALTLPRTFKTLVTCANAMLGPEDSFSGLAEMARLVDSGVMDAHAAADAIVDDMVRSTGEPARETTDAPPLFAWAGGVRNGRPAIATAHLRALPPGGMAGATSIPLSLVLPLFHAGALEQRGVFTPEEIIDPDAFLSSLAPHCDSSFASVDDLVEIRVEELSN
jgi:saccharopine dehydrogenase-like NADP-dependent oxidoreductase